MAATIRPTYGANTRDGKRWVVAAWTPFLVIMYGFSIRNRTWTRALSTTDPASDMEDDAPPADPHARPVGASGDSRATGRATSAAMGRLCWRNAQ